MLLVGVLFGVSNYERNYTRKECDVIRIDGEYIVAEDKCGFIWAFKGNGFGIGDKVDLKMHDNMTVNNIDDDKVIDIVLREGK